MIENTESYCHTFVAKFFAKEVYTVNWFDEKILSIQCFVLSFVVTVRLTMNRLLRSSHCLNMAVTYLYSSLNALFPPGYLELVVSLWIQTIYDLYNIYQICVCQSHRLWRLFLLSTVYIFPTTEHSSGHQKKLIKMICREL